jgi:hypothetical protein
MSVIRHFLRALMCSGLILGTACGTAAPTQPPGAPPTPASVTPERPGGDAHDAHFAALKRQLEADWGYRTDKDRQARFPLPDRRNWKRVRFLLVDHFVGFKYGEDQHTLTAGFVVNLPEGSPHTSAACLEQFERESLRQVAQFGGKVTDVSMDMARWNEKPLIIRKATGHVRVLGKKYDAALSWAGYPAYERGCLVYAVAVPWDGQRDLAEQVRDDFSHGFQRFQPLTSDMPHRR